MTDNDHKDHAARFVESVVMGEIADETFKRECRRLGLDPAEAIGAPTDWLAASNRGTDVRN